MPNDPTTEEIKVMALDAVGKIMLIMLNELQHTEGSNSQFWGLAFLANELTMAAIDGTFMDDNGDPMSAVAKMLGGTDPTKGWEPASRDDVAHAIDSLGKNHCCGCPGHR